MTAKVALTGAGGFLGWHLRAALRESETPVARIELGDALNSGNARSAVDGSSRLIHLAGINRAPEAELVEGNIVLAQQVATAVRAAQTPPNVVVYANSIQAGNGTPYGTAKQAAGKILEEAARDVGAGYQAVCLPNLFGEHGRPFYNAVTATFCHLLVIGETPAVDQDRSLTLLHAQDAADLLTGAVDASAQPKLEAQETVSGLLNRLVGFTSIYKRGEIPDLATKFDCDLFNTYRSHTFPAQAPIAFERHADDRGSFCEIVRSHGGPGQSSFSTTKPGITRGDHFHRRKFERFTVLSGEAIITLRRLFSKELVDFRVDGNAPVAVDMPTMWAHKITNIGSDVLYTSFWTNDIYDPAYPDTIAEVV